MCFESDPDWCRSCGESGDAGTHCATPKWHIRYENPHWRDPQEKARMIDAVHARQIREHGIPTAADLVEISNIIWDKPPCEGWDEMVQSFLDDPMTQYSGMSEEMMPLLKESHRKFHDCPAFKPEYNV